jgi:hypothetical protein
MYPDSAVAPALSIDAIVAAIEHRETRRMAFAGTPPPNYSIRHRTRPGALHASRQKTGSAGLATGAKVCLNQSSETGITAVIFENIC